jgi:hypothetical protein
MSDSGPSAPEPRPTGSFADFLRWRVRDAWPPVVLGWLLLPVVGLALAVWNLAEDQLPSAIGSLAIGVVAVVWLLHPLLTQGFLLRRDRERED